MYLKFISHIMLSLIIVSTASAADNPLRRELSDLWQFQYYDADNRVVAVGHSLYQLDGTFRVSAYYPDSRQQWKEAHYAGTWKLDGRKMTMEIVSTSNATEFPPKQPLTVEILEVTDKYYRYRLPNGIILKECRIK